MARVFKAPLLEESDAFPVTEEQVQDVVEESDEELADAALCCPGPLSCFLASTGFPFWLCQGCQTVRQKEHAVVLNWGKYVGTITEPGFHCVNPCGVELRRVHVTLQTLRTHHVDTTDKSGSPLIVKADVAYKIRSAKKATIDTENVKDYLKEQAQMVLWRVIPQYTYDELRSPVVTDHMLELLQSAASSFGVSIIRFQLVDLNYHSYIAQSMLGRQQAEVDVQTKRAVVFGAADTASQTVLRLRQMGHQITPQKEQQIIHDLLLKNLDPTYKQSQIMFTASADQQQ
jgi:regulator of protease activity HflC (stomatin/prohibitin superfamily)